MSLSKAKGWVRWSQNDQVAAVQLRDWMMANMDVLLESLTQQLIHLKDLQAMLTNERFVRSLHWVLHDWLMELPVLDHDGRYLSQRTMVVKRLMGMGFALDDMILLEELTRTELANLTERMASEWGGDLVSMLRTIDKMIGLDLTVTCSTYVQARDVQMEKVLLDRFLSVTGFSRTLYENLSEVRN